MYVVLEEIEGDTARLIPDTPNEPIYVPVTKIPQPYEIGDVFLVEERQNSTKVYLKRDIKEKERRLKEVELKRNRLLNKSDRKKSE